uniref:Uncharacterized protein n=1 Tax=Chenopodium quinoa TaxID=63459 RepID=A0A803MDG7_CHEQI
MSFPFKVRFVSYPYLPLSPFESSSSYITINGNEETCGSSFSDADSSLMASVDTCGRVSDAFGFLNVQNGDVFGSDGMNKKKKVSREEEDVDGWDWGDFLEQVLEEGKIN